MHDHILVVGGTGMLRDASIALAARCRTLTSVARTDRSLRSLNDALSKARCIHHMIGIDWSDTRRFLAAIAHHVSAVGSPSLVVAWLHEDALGPSLAITVAEKGLLCDFYHVRSSVAADLTKSNLAAGSTLRLPASVMYREVILGFQVSETGSRWLTDAEISDGVLAAIDRPTPITVVGSVTPWSARPS